VNVPLLPATNTAPAKIFPLTKITLGVASRVCCAVAITIKNIPQLKTSAIVRIAFIGSRKGKRHRPRDATPLRHPNQSKKALRMKRRAGAGLEDVSSGLRWRCRGDLPWL